MYLLSALIWSSVAVLALAALWLRWRPDRAARCGECGTAIDGTSSICPKCSHDLREAGVSTPAIRRHGVGPMRPWLIWFLLATVPLVVLIFWLQRSGEDAVLGHILYGPQRILQILAYWFGLWSSLVLIWPPTIALWQGWPRRQVEPHPQCGRCGYGVRGISSMTCPECGSSLQEVGIVTPAVRESRKLNRLKWAIAWLVSLLPMALLTSTFVLGEYGPNEMVYAHSSQFMCGTPGREIVLNIQQTGRQRSWGTRAFAGMPPIQQIELQIGDPRHSSPRLSVDVLTLQCSLVSWAGWVRKDLGELDIDKVAIWLNSTGLDATQADLQPVPAGIHCLLYVMMPNRSSKLASLLTSNGASIRSTMVGTGTGTMRLQWWGILVAIAFWVLVWLAGMWWVLRRPKDSVETSAPAGASSDAAC